MQQLTELQARYDSLQTQQRHSLANVAVLQQQQQQHELEQHRQQQQEHHQQHEQLAVCLTRLQAVESALQDMLRMPCDASSVSRGATPTPRLRGSRPCTPQSPRQMSFRIQQHSIPEHAAAASTADAADAGTGADAAAAVDGTAAVAATAPMREHVRGECESHMIQTITTRVFDSSSRLATGALQQQQPAAADVANSLAAAAEEAAAAARLSHLEFVLVELQELMPLVKAAADAALKACQGTATSAAATEAAAGGVHDGQCAESGVVIQGLSVLGGVERRGSGMLGTGSTVDNAERKQHDQAVQTKEAKATLTGEARAQPTLCLRGSFVDSS